LSPKKKKAEKLTMMRLKKAKQSQLKVILKKYKEKVDTDKYL
jgi:hypothetical protein